MHHQILSVNFIIYKIFYNTYTFFVISLLKNILHQEETNIWSLLKLEIMVLYKYKRKRNAKFSLVLNELNASIFE